MRRKNAGHQLRQPGKRNRVLVGITGPDVGMGERGANADEILCRILNFTQDQVTLVRRRVIVGQGGAIKRDNTTIRESFAQMIEGPAIAETELENGPVQVIEIGRYRV